MSTLTPRGAADRLLTSCPPTCMFGRVVHAGAHTGSITPRASPSTEAYAGFDDPTRSGKEARLVRVARRRESGGADGISARPCTRAARRSGGRAAAPPSRFAWPARDLEERVCRVAAAALAARYWPAEGKRHDAALGPRRSPAPRRIEHATDQALRRCHRPHRGDPEPKDRMRAAARCRRGGRCRLARLRPSEACRGARRQGG